MTHRTLAVVSAGLSQPSSTRLLADQLAAATRDELVRRGSDVELHVVELRDHAHDVVNNLLTGFPPAALREVVDTVAGADGLIAVTPIFSASYSGLFKSFFDVLDAESLVDRPVLIGATGGTARHSLALEHAVRPMFAYLPVGGGPDRGLRRPGGLVRRHRRWRVARPDPARRRGVGRPDRAPAAGHRAGRPVRPHHRLPADARPG